MKTTLRSNPDSRHQLCRYLCRSTVAKKLISQWLLKASPCFVFVLMFLGSSLLEAQQQSLPEQRETQARAQEPIRTAKATRVDRAPRLDGTLDDPAWQTASPIGDFLQREPFEGQTPTEKTEVRVLYDKHDVYFGILCFDSDASNIVASELRRDVLKNSTTISKSSSILPTIDVTHTFFKSTRAVRSGTP